MMSEMKVGDVEVVKVDDRHQEIVTMIESGIVHIQIKNGSDIYAENGEPSITHKEMKIWTDAKGVIHRLDGPAVIDADKDLEKFFIEGTAYTKEEFTKDPRVMTIKKKEIDLDFQGPDSE